VSRSSHVALTYNLSKVIPAHLYALCLLYTRTQAYHLFFAMSINCSIILLTVFNLMLCYIELELNL